MTEVHNPLALVAIYVWVLILVVITGVETWRRYRQPLLRISFSRPVRLHLYKVLDQAEILLAALVVLSFVIASQSPFASKNVTLFIPIALLMVQKVAWIPSLGSRAQVLLGETAFRSSPQHFQYAAIETVKVTSLVLFSLDLVA